MTLLINIFNTILYKPLFNILVLLCKYLPNNDLGLAIIILTIFIKILLYPLGTKAVKSQKVLSELQPKIKEIQEKYKDNKEEQTKAIIALYKKEKINPFSGFLTLFIQLPVLIALYRLFWRGLKPEQMILLYSFITPPGKISSDFFGIINLAHPNLIVVFLVVISQFFQTKMSISKIKTNKSSGFSGQFQKQMQYFMPVFMGLILLKLPSAIGFYLLTTTLFTIIQQYFVFKKGRYQ